MQLLSKRAALSLTNTRLHLYAKEKLANSFLPNAWESCVCVALSAQDGRYYRAQVTALLHQEEVCILCVCVCAVLKLTCFQWLCVCVCVYMCIYTCVCVCVCVCACSTTRHLHLQKAEVRLVDSGDMEEVSCSSLRPLPEQFCTDLPFQGISCSLRNCKSWPLA